LIMFCASSVISFFSLEIAVSFEDKFRVRGRSLRIYKA
jgi:hypothetical protein